MIVDPIYLPSLEFDAALCGDGWRGVTVRGLDLALQGTSGEGDRDRFWREVLRVRVVQPTGSRDDGRPDVAGRHHALADGLRFVPHFPFECGIRYRATFDPRPLGFGSAAVALDFFVPDENSIGRPAVTEIFPSSNDLPTNLLRFYVCFSHPMQRGNSRDEIALLDADDVPIEDALYRAPVELWDRDMRRLTVLLDPGRLKRGVGPNRTLGPPLVHDQAYTLSVGNGMKDLHGRQLSGSVLKRFRTSPAVRDRIAIDRWSILPPALGTMDPLRIAFDRLLDRALLAESLVVLRADGSALTGRALIEAGESQWCFEPDQSWSGETYRVSVGAMLEDPCGNGLYSAFDRPLRAASNRAVRECGQLLSFRAV